jgi:hypothetical protein
MAGANVKSMTFDTVTVAVCAPELITAPDVVSPVRRYDVTLGGHEAPRPQSVAAARAAASALFCTDRLPTMTAPPSSATAVAPSSTTMMRITKMVATPESPRLIRRIASSPAS